mgnify:CR=1 FL=1
MKTATFPAVRVNPELRQAAEEILQEGETLSSFVEQSIRENIERRQFQHAFITRGLRSRDKARQTGRYVSADAVIGQLEEMLASAKAIGELLEVGGTTEQPQLLASVPYAALEAFEVDNRSRMFFKVSGFQGEMVSGFEDLPAWHGRIPDKGIYAALVDFYDDAYRGQPVRVAVLLQPVAGQVGQGIATIQVAETLELRDTLARQLLLDTLWRQAALLAVIAGVVWAVVQQATRPVRALSAAIETRAPDDLSPIHAPQTPRELMPLIDATNHALQRQARLLAHQQRFVRDASHQLRTPLAVLKAQVQSARRGDVAPPEALAEIEHTVDRATQLANQMLALAKVAQLQQQADVAPAQFDEVVRAVALDVAPLIAGKGLDFDLQTEPVTLRAHDWMLRELTRNLLHNAIRHTPAGGLLAITLARAGDQARLTVADGGPGVAPELAERLFQPFSAGAGGTGSGLGLAICHEIVQTLGGRIQLVNRMHNGRVDGLDAIVSLPIE